MYSNVLFLATLQWLITMTVLYNEYGFIFVEIYHDKDLKMLFIHMNT